MSIERVDIALLYRFPLYKSLSIYIVLLISRFRTGGLATKMSSLEIYDIIVFAPHPDDEALGCAGMIYSELKKGRKVNVVLLTNGDADTECWEKLHGCKSRHKDMIEPIFDSYSVAR